MKQAYAGGERRFGRVCRLAARAWAGGQTASRWAVRMRIGGVAVRGAALRALAALLLARNFETLHN
ncbi:protein of unknown function [Burkholderia multivorans]